MGVFSILAETFRYPAPGRQQMLEKQLQSLQHGAARDHLECFMTRLKKLRLNEWEELYTSTLDLNPDTPPYIGYMIWGDYYMRGRFLAQLNHAMQEASIDLDGELPDHLVPVLRYLDRVPDPIEELKAVLVPAVQAMVDSLAKIDPNNLYLEPLTATLEASGWMEEVH